MSKPTKEVRARYREKHREVLREKGLKYYHHDPRKHKDRVLKRRYGISIEDYDTMVVSQLGVCAICEKPERAIQNTSNKIRSLSVDHNHKTGKVRDLLCYSCNAVIGFIENNRSTVKKMFEYLENHDGVVVSE